MSNSISESSTNMTDIIVLKFLLIRSGTLGIKINSTVEAGCINHTPVHYYMKVANFTLPIKCLCLFYTILPTYAMGKDENEVIIIIHCTDLYKACTSKLNVNQYSCKIHV